MGLVILAALCVAAFAITFRLFERYDIPLLPAIAVNYATALLCGAIIAPPATMNDLTTLLLPASLMGLLFVVIFSLTGLSAQRAGAARTTIAGRMSLVLTIAGTVILFHEHISMITLVGIALALAGLILTSVSKEGAGSSGSWALPALIFVCSGIADIGVTIVQRTLTTPLNASIFPTLCFGASTCAGFLMLVLRREQRALKHVRTWMGGASLGVVNYASLLFLMRALAEEHYSATVIFPMMNIFAILIATAAGMLIFQERLSIRQWFGIVLCVSSLSLIMSENG